MPSMRPLSTPLSPTLGVKLFSTASETKECEDLLGCTQSSLESKQTKPFSHLLFKRHFIR